MLIAGVEGFFEGNVGVEMSGAGFVVFLAYYDKVRIVDFESME